MTAGTEIDAAPMRNGRRSYQQSGLYTLKKAVRVLGSRALPTARTSLGRALRDWRDSLVADLGGADVVSTQQLALVDMAVRSKLLLDSVDAFVLGMPSAVNKRSRCLYPIIKERSTLVSQLQGLLRDLGLERRQRPVADLTSFLASRETPHGDTPA